MTGLHSNNEYQGNLFESRRNKEQEVELMNIVDQFNKKFGSGTINFGLVKSQSSWKKKSNRCSGKFTTHWDDLLIVKAGIIF